MLKSIRTNEYRKLVNKIKQARLDSGLTQKQVAEKIKRPQSYISKVEAGEQRIDVIELKQLAKLYKKDIRLFI